MSEQVQQWREDNYERNLFQARVDTTKHRIRKELKSGFANEYTLQHLFSLLDHHSDVLLDWKNEVPTKFQKSKKK